MTPLFFDTLQVTEVDLPKFEHGTFKLHFAERKPENNQCPLQRLCYFGNDAANPFKKDRPSSGFNKKVVT